MTIHPFTAEMNSSETDPCFKYTKYFRNVNGNSIFNLRKIL